MTGIGTPMSHSNTERIRTSFTAVVRTKSTGPRNVPAAAMAAQYGRLRKVCDGWMSATFAVFARTSRLPCPSKGGRREREKRRPDEGQNRASADQSKE